MRKYLIILGLILLGFCIAAPMIIIRGPTVTAGGGTVTTSIAANDDDYYIKESNSSYYSVDGSGATAKIMAGEDATGAEDRNLGLRFQLNVPQGATITAATITMRCVQSYTADFKFKISAHDVDNSAQITNYAGWETAHGTLTDAKVDWDWSNSIDDEEYTTDSLVDIVQEIVNRGGWVANNYIQFFIDDDGTTNYDYFKIDCFEQSGGSDDPAELSVSYTT